MFAGVGASYLTRTNSTLNAISGCAPNTPPRPLIGSVWLYRYLIPSKQRGRPAGRPAILIGKTNGFFFFLQSLLPGKSRVGCVKSVILGAKIDCSRVSEGLIR